MTELLTKAQYLTLTDYHCGYSGWIQVSQAMITEFGTITLDMNPIHIDPNVARERGLESTIAHGMLTLSLAHGLACEAIPKISEPFTGLNMGFDKVRFLEPVPCGSRIRAGFTIASVTERAPGKLDVHVDLVVEIEGKEKPALVAEWRILIFAP